jgi:hypothetical protein
MDSALLTNHIATSAVNAIRVWTCSRGASAEQCLVKRLYWWVEQAAARCTGKKQEWCSHHI